MPTLADRETLGRWRAREVRQLLWRCPRVHCFGWMRTLTPPPVASFWQQQYNVSREQGGCGRQRRSCLRCSVAASQAASRHTAWPGRPVAPLGDDQSEQARLECVPCAGGCCQATQLLSVAAAGQQRPSRPRIRVHERPNHPPAPNTRALTHCQPCRAAPALLKPAPRLLLLLPRARGPHWSCLASPR